MQVTSFPRDVMQIISRKESSSEAPRKIRLAEILYRAFFWGIYVKKTFISAAAVLAFAATAHADEVCAVRHFKDRV